VAASEQLEVGAHRPGVRRRVKDGPVAGVNATNRVGMRISTVWQTAPRAGTEEHSVWALTTR